VGNIQQQMLERDYRRTLPERWPILAPLALFGIALVFRAVDIFALRLDSLET
jgi:hypothetical protein